MQPESSRAPRHRRVACLLAAAAALALAFAASAGASTTLGSRLLTVQQMPTGWTVLDHSSLTSNSITDGACIGRPLAIKPIASATIAFFDYGTFRAFDEALGNYATLPSRGFATAVARLDRCKILSSNSRDRTTTTVAAMSFPRYGDQSAAYITTTKNQGLNAMVAMLLVRKGHVIALFAEAGIGSPDLGQFQGFVRKALAKI